MLELDQNSFALKRRRNPSNELERSTKSKQLTDNERNDVLQKLLELKKGQKLEQGAINLWRCFLKKETNVKENATVILKSYWKLRRNFNCRGLIRKISFTIGILKFSLLIWLSRTMIFIALIRNKLHLNSLIYALNPANVPYIFICKALKRVSYFRNERVIYSLLFQC